MQMFCLYNFFQGDLDVQVSHVRAESRLHVEEGDIHLRLSDAHPLKVKGGFFKLKFLFISCCL